MDLKQRFGRRFRVRWEDGYKCALPAERWWYAIIPAHKGRGHVYVHGPDVLGLATTRKLGLRVLSSIKSAQLLQDGDDGVNLSFAPDDLEAVHRIVKLKIRPRLTPEQRKAMSDRMAVMLAGQNPKEF